MRISNGDDTSPMGKQSHLRKEMPRLPREMRYLLREIRSHLQISGYVTLLAKARIICVLRDFFPSYSRFIGLFAYNKVYREKSNVGILSTKRSHSNYNMPKVSAKIDAFFLRRRISKKSAYSDKRVSFLRIRYLTKKASILAETFCTL